jgi:hypothetical protein
MRCNKIVHLIGLRPSGPEYSDLTDDDKDESYKKPATGSQHPFI